MVSCFCLVNAIGEDVGATVDRIVRALRNWQLNDLSNLVKNISSIVVLEPEVNEAPPDVVIFALEVDLIYRQLSAERLRDHLVQI